MDIIHYGGCGLSSRLLLTACSRKQTTCLSSSHLLVVHLEDHKIQVLITRISTWIRQGIEVKTWKIVLENSEELFVG